jgi:hypothetical protein
VSIYDPDWKRGRISIFSVDLKFEATCPVSQIFIAVNVNAKQPGIVVSIETGRVDLGEQHRFFLEGRLLLLVGFEGRTSINNELGFPMQNSTFQ